MLVGLLLRTLKNRQVIAPVKLDTHYADRAWSCLSEERRQGGMLQTDSGREGTAVVFILVFATPHERDLAVSVSSAARIDRYNEGG